MAWRVAWRGGWCLACVCGGRWWRAFVVLRPHLVFLQACFTLLAERLLVDRPPVRTCLQACLVVRRECPLGGIIICSERLKLLPR